MCNGGCDNCGNCAKKIPVGEPVKRGDPLKIDSPLDISAWYIYHSVSRIRRAYTIGGSLHFAELEGAEEDLKEAISRLDKYSPDRIEPLPEYLRRVAELLVVKLEKARCQGCGHFGCDGSCVNYGGIE